jgi:pimeloyl-ACP methyl ester carboxylesterase
MSPELELKFHHNLHSPLVVDHYIPCVWLVAPKTTLETSVVLVFFHGNAEDLGSCFELLKHFVVGVEYPGYGLMRGSENSKNCMTKFFISDHEPGEELVCSVGRCVLNFLKSVKSVPFENIILVGRSLGSGVAVRLASEVSNLKGLVLVSPFLSILEAAKDVLLDWIATTLVSSEVFSNVELLPEVTCPTLIIHGKKDELIPWEHSKKLFEISKSLKKKLVLPKTMGHNCCLFQQDSYFLGPFREFFDFSPSEDCRLSEQTRTEL